MLGLVIASRKIHAVVSLCVSVKFWDFTSFAAGASARSTFTDSLTLAAYASHPSLITKAWLSIDDCASAISVEHDLSSTGIQPGLSSRLKLAAHYCKVCQCSILPGGAR